MLVRRKRPNSVNSRNSRNHLPLQRVIQTVTQMLWRLRNELKRPGKAYPNSTNCSNKLGVTVRIERRVLSNLKMPVRSSPIG